MTLFSGCGRISVRALIGITDCLSMLFAETKNDGCETHGYIA